MTFRPVWLALSLALAGCQSVDVTPASPSLTIPAEWRTAVGPQSPVEGVWWRNFHDSQLNRYVEQALRQNNDILVARERINEYQARIYAAEGNLFPTLDASLGGTRARSQSAATGQPVHSTLYKGGLTANYDVDRSVGREPQHHGSGTGIAGGAESRRGSRRSDGRLIGGVGLYHAAVAG